MASGSSGLSLRARGIHMGNTSKECIMLKGISPILPPELLSILCEMGHGDTLVIADGNFPAASTAKDCHLVRCDGHGVPEILEAILKLFPLDQYVEKPVTLMDVVPGDDCETPIWDTYAELVSKVDDRGRDVIGTIDRFPFFSFRLQRRG